MRERVIVNVGQELFDITNLGALLFARRLENFELLSRKAVRVILYKGPNRIETVKEHVEAKGYAVGFEGLLDYVNHLLPRNEQIGRALRHEVLQWRTRHRKNRLKCPDTVIRVENTWRLIMAERMFREGLPRSLRLQPSVR